MASHTKSGLVGAAIRAGGVQTPSGRPQALVGAAKFVKEAYYSGYGVIAGTVKEAGSPDLPVKRRVRLYRKQDGVLIKETWSAADGTYQFDRIAQGILYYVISFDHTGNFNAVIKDSITPDVMP